jgi:(2Fe-2S) ferredoxin
MEVNREVLICQYTNCRANGSAEVLARFLEYSRADVKVSGSECQGQCNTGPTVRVLPEEVWYCRVTPRDVPAIVQQHLEQGSPVKALLNPRMHLHGV